MKLFQKFDLVGFISNILAVILGIIITFSIQEVINRKNEKENVKAALELVKEELTSCCNDLDDYTEWIELRAKGARYILENKDTLTKCPKDSIQKYGMPLIEELMITLPDDALELLKTSSLFQSINDNKLAMKIIGAYDRCHIAVQLLDRNESENKARLQSYIDTYKREILKDNGILRYSKIVNTPEGYHFLQQLSGQNANSFRNNIKEIQSVISAIDTYLAE